MKYFKHDSDAAQDAKLRRLRMKYGMEGYGVYWFILELIARNVDKHNLTFELEHDAELISADTGIHHERVQEMMRFMVDLSLFQNISGVITCLKMASRTDEYTQKLIAAAEKAGSVPRLSGESPDSVGRKSVLRKEKKREQKKLTCDEYAAEFVDFWTQYPRKDNKAAAAKAWKKLNPSLILRGIILNDICTRAWGDDKFIPHAATYLNNRRWEDEAQSAPSASVEVYR